MVIADILLISVALVATILASINDLKTREVPDWINYGLVITAITIRLMESILTNVWSYFYYGLIGFIALYLFGILMFRTKQWGGGDAKLIMGLGVVFATRPYFIQESYMPFLVILLINTLLIGAIYGMLYGVYLAIKNKNKFKGAFKALLKEKNMLHLRSIAVCVAVPLFGLSFLVQAPVLRLSMMIVALLAIIYPYLWMFVKSIEIACLLKTIPPSKLTEGDWVEEDIIVNKRVIYKQKNIGIESSDIKRLIKAKVRKVKVKDGIPFTPTFFLGILLSLWNGGILLVL